MMKHMMRIFILAMIFITASHIQSCRKADNKKNTVNHSTSTGQGSEIEKLSAQVDDLNSKLEALGAEYKRLSDSDAELREWSDMVVKDAGKGIWYVCDKRYPRFIGPVKSGGAQAIIEELNKRFRKDRLPEVLFLGNEKDTVIVGISDDAQLTQKMGSDGAMSYINAVVFTLSSVDGISKVKFKFEEGDHAAPGTYTRNFVKSEKQ